MTGAALALPTSSHSGSSLEGGPAVDYTTSTHTVQEKPWGQDTESSDSELQSVEHDGIRPIDGLFGWIPTLAVTVNYMFVFGASNSYGVFSTYYLNIKFAGTSATTLSWIGTLITSLMLICNIFTGALADKKGYRVTAYT
ncbi:hypothetical protein H4S04_007000, partial [Coemansia sp. S16]